jgi:CRISPR-associated protein Cas1
MDPESMSVVAPGQGDRDAELLPVRMLNESVYCPRLFYLMHVMGEWASSVDTVEGHTIHRGVDRRQEPFPPADSRDENDPRVRARSIMLSSERYGIIAKMDVVEHAGNEAVPVDYKHGKPPAVPERAWPPERVQLCAQGLILEEHGWSCDHGVLYFPASRERVDVPFDDDLRSLTIEAIAKARRLEAQASMPAPLEGSPKCPRCSLAAICLPDETNLLCAEVGDDELSKPVVRPLVPGNDHALPLHLTTPGARVSVASRRLVVSEPDGQKQELRFKDISQVSVFGGVQLTTQAVQRLMAEGIPLGYFSSGGWFYGLCAPLGHSAVSLRRRQYARSSDSRWRLQLARELVRNKIRNSRTLLRRNHRGRPDGALERLRELGDQARRAEALESLLGVEGLAAREYFSELGGMLRPANACGVSFDFDGRNRRPPRDPVNAMLSMAYSLLTRHFTAACAIVGLDPHLGFYHADRPGRPSLALDLMEPFRPLLADSAVVTAINNGEIDRSDFLTVGPACAFTDRGRRRFISTFERRLDTEIRHPLFGYRISYRRVIEVQTRLLARHIYGEIASYPAFETR